jgi:hypothetical protein
MIKYLLSVILIFFLQVKESLFAQAPGDSLTVTADSLTYVDTLKVNEAENPVDSIQTEEAIPDSSYFPVTDSSYLFPDTVRKVSREQVRSYTLNPDYAYANDPEYWKNEKPPESGIRLNFLRSPLLRWSVLLGVIALVLVGVYQLVKESSFSWLLRNPKHKKQVTAEALRDEDTDYEEAIRKYQEEGNFRMAVRYMYLRLIRKAKENDRFQIRDSSTNAEIVRVFQSQPFGNEFSSLTKAYEYIFYGGFLPKEELYGSLKTRFDDFQRKLTV